MDHRVKQVRQTILAGIVFFIMTGASSPDPGIADTPSPLAGKRTLVIGKVTDNPKKLYRYLKPIADYVAAHMEDLGIREAKVLMAKNNQQMVSYFKQGKIDWLTETTFSAVYFHEKAGAEFLLKKWKKGVNEYHTIFFTRKDSPINSLTDLKGKTIAFEDIGSTTAYYLPASLLIAKGLELVQLSTIREKPPADMVGYVFSHQEINISTWVYRGLVEAGAFNNLDWNKDDHVRKVYRKEMKIIHESRPFPRAIELVSKDLDPRIKARLKAVLLNAHNDHKASAALKVYQRTKKFEEIDADCRASLEEASRILKIVGSELN
jgi:phosphonate transport system substrate-binding protein